MKKIKTLDTYFDENGISYATIMTELGAFNGTCKLHDEDKDIVSEFQGCRWAEMRAGIKYLQEKVKLLKIKVDTLENLINTLSLVKGYEKDSVEARYLRKQYFINKNEYQIKKKNIQKIKENLYNSMKYYRKDKEDFLNKIQNKKESVE